MIHTISRAIEPAHRPAVVPCGPLLEWDSLTHCMIPTVQPSDREPRELLRGDVMLGGPWSYRGDKIELKKSDEHERIRLYALSLLGLFDERLPDFNAPEFDRRRQRVETLLCLGSAGVPGMFSAFAAAPVRKPELFTRASRYYDAGYGRTGAITGLANQGAGGATYDAANASSTLTYTASYTGAFDAMVGDGTGTNNWLDCGSTAANWRVHNGTGWSCVVVGAYTPGAISTLAANRATVGTATGLGFSVGWVSAGGLTFRWRVSNATPAQVLSAGPSTLLDSYTQPFVAAWRYTTAVSPATTHLTRTIGTLTSGTQTSETNAPSNSDSAGPMRLMCCTDGTTGRLNGKLCMILFDPADSAAAQQARMDHARAIARI